MKQIRTYFLAWFAVIPLIILLNLFSELKRWITWIGGLSNILFGAAMLVWGRTVRSRIIHTKTRHCLTGVSWALFALFVIRSCRWQFFDDSQEAVNHFFWYLYYVPFIAVPLLSYQAALGIRAKKVRVQQNGLRIVWATGILMAAGVLTNGLHGQLLRFAPDGSYSYGWLFFTLIVWSVLLSVGVLFLLIRRCRLSLCRRNLYIPVCMSASGLVMLTWYHLSGGSPELSGMKLFHLHEVYAVVYIGLWEGCILIGLLPSNTGYQRLFSQSHINAVLTDQSSSVWYSSVHVEPGSGKAELVQHTMPLRGGSITWSEDLHTIRQMREELAEANERLEEENDLIEEENRITAERTRYETQNRLYDRIALHTHKQLAEIAESFRDADVFSEGLRKNLLLGTYVKRCANLMLLADANRQLSTEELKFALRETLDTMRLSGTDCSLRSGSERLVPAWQLAAAYDAAEMLAEAVYGRCSAFCACTAPDADCILLLETDAEITPDMLHPGLTENGLQASLTCTDGTYRVRIGGERHAS